MPARWPALPRREGTVVGASVVMGSRSRVEAEKRERTATSLATLVCARPLRSRVALFHEMKVLPELVITFGLVFLYL